MRSQQRVAVALRSVAQRLPQGRRLDRLIDLGKFVEVVARAMGQGDRNTVGRHPTMLLTILQHADSAFPSGSFAFSNGIEGLAPERLASANRSKQDLVGLGERRDDTPIADQR